MLTKNEFTVLNTLRTATSNSDTLSIASQAQLAECSKLSVGTVNTTLKSLRERNFVDTQAFMLTETGARQLDPFRVDNAIIMAAGFSSRFAPLSYERPKGLLTVCGEVLIERQIRQLQEAGINDITVIVGYLKEHFFYLADKFKVKIVVNEEYSTRNNHSSLYRVRNDLKRTYICSCDNYFAENVFEPYVYEAYYAGVYSEGPTEEWCMKTGSHDVINRVSIGGINDWYMLGHAFFDESFSMKMREILEAEYELPVTRTKLWEHLYMDHLDELRMVLRKYPDGVIFEFDSIAEMQDFDGSFIDNVDSSILDNIASVLNCKRTDVLDIEPIKQGITNLSCKFRVGDTWYVYRHPGVGTSRFINRSSEAFSEKVAVDLGLDGTFLYEDPDYGWKISYFRENCVSFDYHNEEHVAAAMTMARELHGSGIESPYSADLCNVIEQIASYLKGNERASFPDFNQLMEQSSKLCSLVAEDEVPPCLCHNDFYAPNYLIHESMPEGESTGTYLPNGSKIDLIDWEYSGMSDYASDLGTFICCCEDYHYDDVLAVLREYFKRDPSDGELRHCLAYVALAAFRWYVWALYQDMVGNPVGELLYTWYRFAHEYGSKALALYGK